MARLVGVTNASFRVGLVLAMALMAACGGKGGRIGSFTDPRDGQAYRTVKIGNQVWMAENLNYKTDSSWCYDEEESNCKKYGRLYDWEQAKAACPNGWHLPSREEWRNLIVAAIGVGEIDEDGNVDYDYDVTGKKLKSISGWSDFEGISGNGTDDLGFAALPGGYRSSPGSSSDSCFFRLGYAGSWWGTTWYWSGRACLLALHSKNSPYNMVGEFPIRHFARSGLSVRCVQDVDGSDADTVSKAAAPQPADSNVLFTDTRDGQKYRTVRIGDQWWMAENLNYKTGASWCYDDDESNCIKYGRLYNLETAAKVCPTGWHLPSASEWDDLVVAANGVESVRRNGNGTYYSYATGKKLKSMAGWDDFFGNSGNGTDEFGFSAMPGGSYKCPYAGCCCRFESIGGKACWWGSTSGNYMVDHYMMCMTGHNDLRWDSDVFFSGHSVRCIQDWQKRIK